MKKFNCNKTRSAMTDFVEYKLTTEEAYKLVEHCRECSECFEELKVLFLIRTFLRDEHNDDIEEEVNAEIEEKFESVKKRVYFSEMLNRHMKYFVVGATIFIILSYIVDMLY